MKTRGGFLLFFLIAASLSAFGGWGLDVSTPSQGYLTNDVWRLRISTTQNSDRKTYKYLKTVTNARTGATYTGYELASGCLAAGSGALDLSMCKADAGYDVVSLASSAFYQKSAITSFTAPAVVNMGASAFREAKGLVSCEVSPEVFWIGDRQFLDASALETFEPTKMPELYYIGTTNNAPSTFYTKTSLLKGDFLLGHVTYVNPYAFYGTGITSIELPECVHVDSSTFSYCTSLTNIVLPKASLVGALAFIGCANVERVTVDGEALVSVGNNAFSGLSKAEGWPTDYPHLEAVGADGFRDTRLAGDVRMPKLALTDRSFYGCTRLTSFYAPSLVSYGYQDFRGCTALTNVTLDGSASYYALSPGNKRGAGDAFTGCTAMRRLVWLGATAPTNKPNSNVFSLAGNANAAYRPVIVEIRDGRDRAAWESLCTVLAADLTDEYKLIPNYDEVRDCLVGYMGTKPPVKNGAISGQYYPMNGEICWIVDRPLPYEPPAWTWDPATGTCTDGEWTFKTVGFDSRNRIYNTYDNGFALTECLGYTGKTGKLDFTRFAETVGETAAAYGLEAKVKSIARTTAGVGCLQNVTALTEVIAPDVVFLAPYAFYGAANLRNVTVSDDVHTLLNDSTFAKCTSLTNIVPKVCAKVTSAEKYALLDVPLAGAYEFPAVTNMPKSGFRGLAPSAGLSLSFPNLERMSATQAFYLNAALTNFYAPKLVTVTSQAFQDCTNLLSVVLSDRVEAIANNAFLGDKRLASFQPTNMVALSSLGEYAFNNAHLPHEFCLPLVTNLGIRVFAYSNVRAVRAPKATFSGRRTFECCTNLVSLAIRGSSSLGGEWSMGALNPWCVVDWLGPDVPESLPLSALTGRDGEGITRRITVCLHRASARRKWLAAWATRRKADFTYYDRANLTYPDKHLTLGVCDGTMGNHFWMTRPDRPDPGFALVIDGGLVHEEETEDEVSFDVSNAVHVAGKSADNFLSMHPDGTSIVDSERPLWSAELDAARAAGNEYAEYKLSRLATEEVETAATRAQRAAALRTRALAMQRDDGLFRDIAGSEAASAATNGLWAVELARVLRNLDEDDASYDDLYDSFEMLVEALERKRASTGLWPSDLDDASSGSDWYASARLASAIMTGATYELIAGAAYAKFARKTWTTFTETPAKIEEAEGDDEVALLKLVTSVIEEDRYGANRTTWKGIGGQDTLASRADGAKSAPTGTLKLEQTYSAISVAYGAVRRLAAPKLEYRVSGASAWRSALTPLFFRPSRQYRGSIVNLSEDTDYEVRISDGSTVLATAAARTWATDVPIAETVVIDTAKAQNFPIQISRRGTATGWIRYVPKDKSVVLTNATTKTTFNVNGAQYVLIDDFTIDGGFGQNSILFNTCNDVRVRNCELYHFGPGGLPTYSGGSKGYCSDRKSGLGDQAAAIVLKSYPVNVTIERCLIHSPRGRAHSWRYSHPYGAEGIQYQHPDGGLVIRYCDIFTSDTRRWEDAIKCLGNSGYNSGANRNADIHGNFLFGCNDDGCELDGGQQNVRFWGNRVEDALMGVSIQYNQTSPSYVYDNLFSGLGTEFWHLGSAVKTSSVDAFKMGSASFVFNNTFTGTGSDSAGGLDLTANSYTARIDARNNLHVGYANRLIPPSVDSPIRMSENIYFDSPASVVATAVSAIPNFHEEANLIAGAAQAADDDFPRRPIPWHLSTNRIEVTVTNGVATPAAVAFAATCGGSGYAQAFRVVRTVRDSDWYAVSPMKGTIASDGTVAFTVAFDAAKMMGRRKHAAAFVVRTADGFSRPVTIHAQTDRVESFTVDDHGKKVVYGVKKVKGEGVGVGEGVGEGEVVWSFELPELESGKQWYVVVHGRNLTSDGTSYYPAENVFKTRFNDTDKPECRLQLVPWWTWVPYAPGESSIHGFVRAAGTHTITVEYTGEHVEVDGMAMTEDPGLFEPEGAHAIEEME